MKPKYFIVLLKKEYNLFLLSNLIFSASTYAVLLLIPYLLNIEKMAEWSSVYNALMILVFIFEFGTSVSYLRYYRIKTNAHLINSILQLFIIVLVFVLIYTPQSKYIFSLLKLDTYKINESFPLLALMAQLSWIFAKNILIAYSKYKYIALLAISILLIRIIGLLYLFSLNELTIDNILIFLFIFPFMFAFCFITVHNLSRLISCWNQLFIMRLNLIFIVQLKRFIKFSFASYLIGMLYVLTSRYPIIFLTDNKSTEILADLGFSMSFLGIITIASASFRTYFIAAFHLGDMLSIQNHIKSYLKKVKFYGFLLISIGLVVSLIVYVIKPDYLSIRAPIFVFILLSSYSLIFLMSLITFLSKTMNYNSLEIKINSIRLVVIYLLCQLLFLHYPILSFILINAVMVGSEYAFARIILKRLRIVI